MTSPGTFDTPAGFLDRCTLRDDSAAHQIRILCPGGTHLVVSCTCRKGGVGPIARITTLEEAWRAYNGFHKEIIDGESDGTSSPGRVHDPATLGAE